MRSPVGRALAVVSLCLAGAAIVPTGAAAHPLGNFSVNHLSQVRISADRVQVHYILDQAEIPTFQEAQEFDSDGSGAVDGAERGPLLRQKLGEIAPNLELTVDGRRVPLSAPHNTSCPSHPVRGG